MPEQKIIDEEIMSGEVLQCPKCDQDRFYEYKGIDCIKNNGNGRPIITIIENCAVCGYETKVQYKKNGTLTKIQ